MVHHYAIRFIVSIHGKLYMAELYMHFIIIIVLTRSDCTLGVWMEVVVMAAPTYVVLTHVAREVTPPT